MFNLCRLIVKGPVLWRRSRLPQRRNFRLDSLLSTFPGCRVVRESASRRQFALHGLFQCRSYRDSSSVHIRWTKTKKNVREYVDHSLIKNGASAEQCSSVVCWVKKQRSRDEGNHGTNDTRSRFLLSNFPFIYIPADMSCRRHARKLLQVPSWWIKVVVVVNADGCLLFLVLVRLVRRWPLLCRILRPLSTEN